MASEAVHGHSVVEGHIPCAHGRRPSAKRALASCMRFAALAVSLLLLLSLAVLASSRGYGVQLGLRGLRTHAPAMCDVAFKALLKSMHEPAHYEQDYDTPPDCEIKAFHTEDTEEATGLDEAPSGLTISLTPLLPRTASEPACAAASWVPDLLESSTLPRGPPLG